MPAARRKRFAQKVRMFYKNHGRHHLPWRHTRDPYKILVSEIMLQQTQVDRVIPKYELFLKKFPTVQELSNASLAEVLKLWSGLGYNRRAKMLHETAKIISRDHNGIFPKERSALEALPGIGPYTAGAVCVFAYNKQENIIETNIRTVFLHEFFKDKEGVADTEILQLTGVFLNGVEPREWYAALMDYGAYLKKLHPNPSRKSKHHAKQSAFEGSTRQLRGCIVRELANQDRTQAALKEKCARSMSEVQSALSALELEGLIEKKGRAWELSS